MDYHELNDQDRELLELAVEASRRLYVPGIQEVGAAVRTSTGQTYSGIHFESSTGFADVCGEIAALSCMVAGGQRDLDTIVAVWHSREGEHYLLPPCGRCREVISDFNPQAWVIIPTLSDHWDVTAIDHPGKVRIGDLIPMKSHTLKQG